MDEPIMGEAYVTDESRCDQARAAARMKERKMTADELADRAQYVARAAVAAAAVGDSGTAAKWLMELDECVRKLMRQAKGESRDK
jgi:hypothetical protein